MRKLVFALLILFFLSGYKVKVLEKAAETKKETTSEQKQPSTSGDKPGKVYVEIIDKIEKITCGVCGGTGFVKCKECNGNGEGNETECPFCGGMCKKKVYGAGSKKATKNQMMTFHCSKCRKDFEDWVSCSACRGKGDTKCHYCGGYGFIINKISHWEWVPVKGSQGTKGVKDGNKK